MDRRNVRYIITNVAALYPTPASPPPPPPPSAVFLQQESGSFLLQETGDKLELESGAAADEPITGLPAASLPLTGSELVVLVQGGVTSQTTALDISNLAP